MRERKRTQSIKPNQLLLAFMGCVGIWRGYEVIVEDDDEVHKIHVKDHHDGECYCWVRVDKHTRICYVREEFEVNQKKK